MRLSCHGMRWPAGAVFCLLAWAGSAGVDAAVIHKERSLYQTILVEKSGSTVCLRFSSRRNQRTQSCIDQDRPREMVFEYTRMMMAALMLNPAPRRMLFAGLGGGTLPMALTELYPEAAIDVAEIDAAVVAVAKDYFGFVPSDRLQVHIQDARIFAKRAAKNREKYDLILLDAFNSDYIPEHLMTREFLLETRSLLTEDGVLVANTFASSTLYDHESATYSDVFGPFFNFRLPNSANRVILAARQPLPDILTLRRRATELRGSLGPFGIDILNYSSRLATRVDWDTGARVLTDQYSPANLLQGQ